MKKLWLSAIAAAFMLAGNAAQAGDHRGHDHYRDRGYSEYRRCDRDWDRHDYGRHNGWSRSRPVYYGRPVVYERPIYYSRPVVYERGYREYRRYDDDIHGSITIGF